MISNFKEVVYEIDEFFKLWSFIDIVHRLLILDMRQWLHIISKILTEVGIQDLNQELLLHIWMLDSIMNFIHLWV